MMGARKWFWFWLAFVCVVGVSAGSANAGPIPLTWRGIKTTWENGGTHLRGTSPSEIAAANVSVANHVVSTTASANWYAGAGALVQNGGVVFNAAIPIAVTAAEVAVTAVRANPAGLITTAIASYLLTKGIELVDGEFKKLATGPSPTEVETVPATSSEFFRDDHGQSQPLAVAAESVCRALILNNYTQAGYTYARWYKVWPNPLNGEIGCVGNFYQGGQGTFAYSLTRTGAGYSCDSGWTLSGTNCTRPVEVTTYQPATDSDWAAARTGYWPDPAILDLVKKGVPLPTDKPVYEPEYKDVPLSDPYVDPVSGKRLQDMARVTPSATSPEVAEVQVMKQEVDANGVPVQSGGAPVAPVEEKDPCKIHPEASGCAPLDEAPDGDLPEDEITLSLSPVAGFGPDNGTCPSPRTLFTKAGQSIVWSWGMYCDFAAGLRPLIVGFAWLSALAMVVVAARRVS